jgi:hypothetical protein
MPRTAALKPEQVPANSKPTLDTFTKNIGFTPNMMATFAQSPVAFNAWATLLVSAWKVAPRSPVGPDGVRLYMRGISRRVQDHHVAPSIQSAAASTLASPALSRWLRLLLLFVLVLRRNSTN